MNIKLLMGAIKGSNNIVFFGGAGMSTESGIPDFRSENGLYRTSDGYEYSPETMLSHSFYVSHTTDFYKFYKEKMIFKDAKPNDGHKALARLEQSGKLTTVITQNIDGLHQLAGSKNVYELHGSVHRNYCTKCHAFYDLQQIINSEGIPLCPVCQGTIKPDVVLYEETLDENVLKNSIGAIEQCDLLIVGGTSLVVYPAAGLINYFHGKKLILINKASTPYDSKADIVIHDSVGRILGQAVSSVLDNT